jgi:hypothetical protein
MTLNEFIHKYTYLCDKNHHLVINFGNIVYNNCFNNNLNSSQITNVINYLEHNKFSIINSEKGQIGVYSNEYLNITNNSITEYTIIDSIIDKKVLIKFAQINKNKNICSYRNTPDYEYDYELVTTQINDGCNIDILKKYNNNNTISYNLTLSVYKPCKINDYIDAITKILS